MIQKWTAATDGTGSSVRVILFDFKKAFDLIDHHLLLKKLDFLQINERIKDWIINFLSHRRQRIKISNNCYSDWANVPSGVPQGTKLGPWLFVLMINDLHPTCDLWKYVDDTTISEIIKRNSQSLIQNPTDSIQIWSETNRFHLHPDKSKELRINFQKTTVDFPKVTINEKPIEIVDSVKLLGLSITNNLKWNLHIENIVKKASTRLYLLIQLKRARIPEKELILFFCTCIRPILEYACQIFHNSLTQYLSHDLERIQIRALSIIYPYTRYSDALLQADLEPLEQRRATITSKLFHDIVSNPQHKLHSLLPPLNNDRYNLRGKRMFSIPQSKTNRMKSSFIIAEAKKFRA